MSGFDWFLIGWWLFGLFCSVWMVGRPRDPVTPLAAAIGLLITAALIAGLLWSRGAL